MLTVGVGLLQSTERLGRLSVARKDRIRSNRPSVPDPSLLTCSQCLMLPPLMCYFITLVLRGSDRAAIAPVAMRHGRRATPIHNPSVESILKPGEAQFLTTVGHCDCGTALGQRGRGQAAKLAKKLAKKGWSPSKIERGLSDRTRADERAQGRQRAHRPDSVDLWSNLIRDLFALPDVQQVGLLLHFYSRNVETEVFDVRRSTVGFDDFAARLPKIDTRELLMVERSAPLICANNDGVGSYRKPTSL